MVAKQNPHNVIVQFVIHKEGAFKPDIAKDSLPNTQASPAVQFLGDFCPTVGKLPPRSEVVNKESFEGELTLVWAAHRCWRHQKFSGP